MALSAITVLGAELAAIVHAGRLGHAGRGGAG